MGQIFSRFGNSIARAITDVLPLGAASWLLAALAAFAVASICLPRDSRRKWFLALLLCLVAGALGGAAATLAGFGGTMNWDPRSAILVFIAAAAARIALAARLAAV